VTPVSERVWSPSAVETYESCPRQWKLRYDAADPSQRAQMVAAAPAHLREGTAAHAAIEAAYRAARSATVWLPSRFMSVFADEAMDRLHDIWAELSLESEPYAIEDEVQRTLAKLPLPRPDNIIGVELRLPARVHGVPFTNILDLALRTGPNSLHIRDWKRKSLRTLPKRHELPEHRALCSYRCAVAQHYPWATHVTVGLYSLVANREVVTDLPLARAEHTMAAVVDTVGRAESDTEWLPTPDGRNCSTCRVRPACPVWIAAGEAAQVRTYA